MGGRNCHRRGRNFKKNTCLGGGKSSEIDRSAGERAGAIEGKKNECLSLRKKERNVVTSRFVLAKMGAGNRGAKSFTKRKAATSQTRLG